MKKIVFAILGILLVYANLQASPPISSIEKAFTQRYPAASFVRWEQSGKSNWEAQFLYSGYKVLVVFNKHGRWIKTKTNIRVNDLPPTVETSMHTQYPGWNIDKLLKSETPRYGVSYKAEINNGKEAKVVVFNDGRWF